MKPLEWSELWKKMDNNPELWIPTTKEQYWAILEAVPPTAMIHNAFLGGEPNHHDSEGKPVYAAFRIRNKQYKARYLTFSQFKEECYV